MIWGYPLFLEPPRSRCFFQAEARQAAKAEAKPSPAKVEEQVDGMGLKGEPAEVGSLSYSLQAFGIYPNGGWAEPWTVLFFKNGNGLEVIQIFWVLSKWWIDFYWMKVWFDVTLIRNLYVPNFAPLLKSVQGAVFTTVRLPNGKKA